MRIKQQYTPKMGLIMTHETPKNLSIHRSKELTFLF